MRTSRIKTVSLNVAAGLLASVLLMAVVGADAAPSAKTRTAKAKTTKTVGKITRKAAPKSVPKTARKSTKVKTAAATEPTADPAVAAAVQSTQSLSAKPAEKPKKSLGLLVSVSRGRSMVNLEDGNYRESTDVLADVSFQLTENYKALMELTYSRDEINPEGSDWGDTFFMIGRKAFEISKTMKFAPNLRATIPTSKDSTQRANLMGSVGVGGSLGFNPGVLAEGFSLSFDATLIRQLHQYETAADGRVNNQWSSRQRVLTGYQLGKIGFAFVLAHNNALSYGGNLSETFLHNEEISYGVTDNFSVAVGHVLTGATLKPNGQDSNYALTNENASVVYLGLTGSY